LIDPSEEQVRFYDAGYTDGFAHGRIHGLIEGRALGREKGFEIWEEIGFYEGFAITWQAIYAKHGQTDQYVSCRFSSRQLENDPEIVADVRYTI
jgi:hypothetical protein